MYAQAEGKKFSLSIVIRHCNCLDARTQTCWKVKNYLLHSDPCICTSPEGPLKLCNMVTSKYAATVKQSKTAKTFEFQLAIAYKTSLS